MIVTITATVWVCDNCGEYYAASSAGDLREQWNTDMKGQPTFPRAQCPTMRCTQQGLQRRPVSVDIPLLELAYAENG